MSFELEIGRIGEDLVARWLKSKGYIILRQNYRCDYGEIDIVAENPKVIAFVEVKTRKENSLVTLKNLYPATATQQVHNLCPVVSMRRHMEVRPCPGIAGFHARKIPL